PGMNGALAFGVSNTGYVVGSSMFNQGSGMPFIWSDQGGMVAIPLVSDTSQGTAQGQLQRMRSGHGFWQFLCPLSLRWHNKVPPGRLVPPNSDWDLSTNTFSSALEISEDNVIVGTGV